MDTKNRRVALLKRCMRRGGITFAESNDVCSVYDEVMQEFLGETAVGRLPLVAEESAPRLNFADRANWRAAASAGDSARLLRVYRLAATRERSVLRAPSSTRRAGRAVATRREAHGRPAKANAPPSTDPPLSGRPPVQYRRSAFLVVCALEKYTKYGPQSRGKIVRLLTQAGISEPSIKRHLRRLVAEGVIVEVTVPGDRRKFYRLADRRAVAA